MLEMFLMDITRILFFSHAARVKWDGWKNVRSNLLGQEIIHTYMPQMLQHSDREKFKIRTFKICILEMKAKKRQFSWVKY